MSLPIPSLVPLCRSLILFVLLIITSSFASSSSAAYQKMGQIDRETNSHDVVSGGTYSSLAYAIAVQGDYAYIGIEKQLVVLNISDPDNPRLAGQPLTWVDSVYDVAVAGDIAYVAAGTEGLRIVNVANPAFLTEVSAFYTYYSARAVVTTGKYAYLADFWPDHTFSNNENSGLRVIRITTPDAPEQVAFLDVEGEIYGITVNGNHLYLSKDIYQGGGKVQVVNISNPSLPSAGFSSSQPGPVYDFAINGTRGYAALGYPGGNTGGLRLYEIADPAHPIERSYYDTPDEAISVAAAGTYAYFSTGESGLHIFDVSEIVASPKGVYDPPEYVGDVAIEDNYAYVVVENGQSSRN